MRTRQSGGGTGRHDQTLPVARATAAEKYTDKGDGLEVTGQR